MTSKCSSAEERLNSNHIDVDARIARRVQERDSWSSWKTAGVVDLLNFLWEGGPGRLLLKGPAVEDLDLDNQLPVREPDWERIRAADPAKVQAALVSTHYGGAPLVFSAVWSDLLCSFRSVGLQLSA